MLVLLSMEDLGSKSDKEKGLIALKLHKQFGHSLGRKLKIPIFRFFILLMSLLGLVSGVLLHKKEEVIVSAILQHWVSIFGSPGKFISDNGGEFNNELLRDLGEQLNTRVLTTAAESPWSELLRDLGEQLNTRFLTTAAESPWSNGIVE